MKEYTKKHATLSKHVHPWTSSILFVTVYCLNVFFQGQILCWAPWTAFRSLLLPIH